MEGRKHFSADSFVEVGSPARRRERHGKRPTRRSGAKSPCYDNRRDWGGALVLHRYADSLRRHAAALPADCPSLAVRPCTYDWRAGVRPSLQVDGKPLPAWGLGHGTIGGSAGTFVPFQERDRGITFIPEQFWGRAARASVTRKSLGARFIFGENWADYVGADASSARGASAPQAGELKLAPRARAPGATKFRARACVICGGHWVEMVKFTVMRASVSTAWPDWR